MERSMAEFPQVPEHGVPPEIATLYADIRAVSGLPVVNLIWRHFAALPGVLPWVWGATRPLIGSAELDGARERLASGVSLPPIPPPSIMAWRSAGMVNRDLQRIAAMNDAYIRGNLTNVLALTALRLRLERPDHSCAAGPLGLRCRRAACVWQSWWFPHLSDRERSVRVPDCNPVPRRGWAGRKCSVERCACRSTSLQALQASAVQTL